MAREPGIGQRSFLFLIAFQFFSTFGLAEEATKIKKAPPSPPAQSVSFIDQIKEKIRPTLENWFKKEVVDGWLGKEPERVSLPTIPRIVQNAKSVQGIGEKTPGPEVKKEFSADDVIQDNLQFLSELYEVVYFRQPKEDELGKWINTLNQGASREGIYRNLVLGTDYDELERINMPLDDKTIEFTLKFLKTYINLKVDEETLAQMNLFSVKKICVEKSLEIMDVLAKRPEELYDWYAVLSVDLAKHHGPELGKRVRQEVDAELHKKWATQVPFHYLQTEVIIKLHRIFNSFANLKTWKEGN